MPTLRCGSEKPLKEVIFIEDKLIFSYLNWLLVVFASLLFIFSVINDLKEMF